MVDNEDNRELVTEAVFRYKHSLANAAQKSKATIRYLNQQTLTFNKEGSFRNNWLGVCAGLSIDWIKARVAGVDPFATLVAMRDAHVGKHKRT